MNQLANLQTELRDIIKARAYFASVPVIIDDGNIREAIEDALGDYGVCVIVDLPVGFSTKSTVGRTINGEIETVIELLFSPESNLRQPSPKNITEAVGELMLGISGEPFHNGRRGWEVTHFVQPDTDPGLVQFLVFVSRPLILQ